jgi:hypothetical protein
MTANATRREMLGAANPRPWKSVYLSNQLALYSLSVPYAALLKAFIRN